MIKEIKNTKPKEEENETINQPYFVKMISNYGEEKTRYIHLNQYQSRFEVIEVESGFVTNHHKEAIYVDNKTKIKMAGTKYLIIKGEIKFENV